MKPFAWSYSKLKNFETCPKRHYEVDINKTYKEEDSEQLVWGNRVHKSMADALGKNVPLPDEMSLYQGWVDKVKAGPGILLVEQKYALTKDLKKTEYFAPNVWYRGIGDVVRIHQNVGLILDWKTGKPLDDNVQLGLMAQCLFSNYPALQAVRSEFVWLKDATTSPETFTRETLRDMWTDLIDRVGSLEHAYATETYPPKPSFLCKRYCPVQSCPYFGKDNR